MAKPLDYRNPQTPDGSEPPLRQRRETIPIEFDTRLTQLIDLAAAKAMEDALRRHQIPVHVMRSEGSQTQVVELIVRGADHPRAWDILGKVLVRRKKLKSLPKTEPPKPDIDPTDFYPY